MSPLTLAQEGYLGERNRRRWKLHYEVLGVVGARAWNSVERRLFFVVNAPIPGLRRSR